MRLLILVLVNAVFMAAHSQPIPDPGQMAHRAVTAALDKYLMCGAEHFAYARSGMTVETAWQDVDGVLMKCEPLLQELIANNIAYAGSVQLSKNEVDDIRFA